MSRNALLIDYEWCSNCHTCEVSCKEEKDIPTGKWGIKVYEIGPWEIADDKWQLKYVPVPTDMCDLCAGRIAKGKKHTCVKHCQSLCMEYGPVEELAKKMDASHMVLFTVC